MEKIISALGALGILKKKPALGLIIESLDRTKGDVYQHQLLVALKKTFSLRILEVKDLGRGSAPDFPLALTTIRQRKLLDHADALARIAEKSKLFIYDQDPWQSFIDEDGPGLPNPYKGTHAQVRDRVNPFQFLVPSRTWADRMNQRGMPCTPVTIDVSPRYITEGIAWEKRARGAFFQGKLYPHRKAFFDYLEKAGAPVEVLPAQSFQKYLDNLSRGKAFVHCEVDPISLSRWHLDGRPITPGGLWAIEMMASARGIFVIRDFEEEISHWGLDKMPTVLTFRKPSEVPALVESVLSQPAATAREKIAEAIALHRARVPWSKLVTRLSEEA